MGLSDELEALRAKGSVRAKSTRLSAEVSKHGFTSPEAEAERLKQKSLEEKQSRLDAQANLQRGASGAAMNDLNLLYKKLIQDQREKKREAQKNLSQWRKSKYVGKGGGGDGGEGEEPCADDDDSGSSDGEVNQEALEMLPEHVVSALKAKYETDDAASALAQALKEEGDDGKGTLATLMEVQPSPVHNEAAPRPFDETSEEGSIEEEETPVAKAEAGEAAVTEEKKEAEPEEVKVDEAKADPQEDEEEETKTEEPVIEEVREKMEELSISIDEGDKEEEEKEAKDAAIEEASPTTPKAKPDLSQIPNETRILQTQRFYNTHHQEYIDNISSPPHSPSLTPTYHRDAFIAHVHLQQHLNTNDSTTMIDLGCGYGRDALHFTSLGHHVLGVDYSKEMLGHARKLAPKGLYLNMDFRNLKDVLVGESVDGVWASASLFHLPKGEVGEVLKGLCRAVKVGGVLFLSLKKTDWIEEVEQLSKDNNGEVFEADERYAVSEDAPFLTAEDGDNNENAVVDDTRRKLYSYYTQDEVKELLTSSGWDIMQMGEDDRKDSSDYVKHSMLYAFATRQKTE